MFNLLMGRCKPTTGQVRLFGMTRGKTQHPTGGSVLSRI